ncbi:hypothetical protein QBC45DRAFT_154304 [Copromyces sp. CBS 386.78]|nr:hypothetical protein QBC45DRAFT_154304 [Copromyces sp. CBS 386.78]
MASLLRQIVAGPRLKHEDTGLDLCYVTSNIIATSGPSDTYPQRAYRNPLDRLVAFLDEKHGDGWSIWEFRAEGTGYPDEAVYNRIRHYPWPDHHPPPFRLVPMITASMRNWLDGEDEGASRKNGNTTKTTATAMATTDDAIKPMDGSQNDNGKERNMNTTANNNLDLDRPRQKGERVVVVHCKAGKGRSGTSICSYLISECGWTAADALARFTERRMRPNFGKGVSIPSQLRYVGYVDRWANAGTTKKKVYVDRPIEIVEIHVWGLRHGVKLAVEGFADEGKRIETLHTFGKGERIVVQGDAPGGGWVMDIFYDMAGYGAGKESNSSSSEEEDEKEKKKEVLGLDGTRSDVDDAAERSAADSSSSATRRSRSKEKAGKMGSRASSLVKKLSVRKSKDHKEKELEKKKSALSGSPATTSDGSIPKLGETTAGIANAGKAKTIAMPKASEVTKLPSTEQNTVSGSTSNLTPIRSKTSTESSQKQQKPVLADEAEPGGQAVIFKPQTPIIVPNSDINIDIERRSRASASVGLTMVTSIGHVWFNAFFEGNGPEQDGKADESGVFEIEWDKLDGIKGSSRKGTRALERLSVVWRVAGTGGAAEVAAADAGVAKGGEQTTTAGAASAAAPETVITQPGDKSPVPQMKPADWKGVGPEHLPKEKELGLRAETTESASVSKASSLKDLDVAEGGSGLEGNGGKGGDNDDESLAGVKTSDPKGEELDEVATPKASA